MTISEQSARLIYLAIAYTIGRIYPDLCETESPLDVINDNAKEFMTDFCAIKGIDKVAMNEDEEDEDIPDDVDETNYDPYLGQDFYE